MQGCDQPEATIPGLDDIPLFVIAIGITFLMVSAAMLGYRLRQVVVGSDVSGSNDNQEAYVVSAVLGLIALFMGFTLALSLDRFETRRTLVLEEANALGTAYLRTQLLPEPHRARLTALLTSYLDNRIALGDSPPDQVERFKVNDQLLADLWAATAAAFDAVKQFDFSTSYLDSINAVIDLDTSRKTAHAARVPIVVFVVLFCFILVGSGLLGYVLTGRRGRLTAGTLLLMLALALLLMMDIDRPSRGLIQETQGPLEALQRSIATEPPAAFDKWRAPA